MKNTAKQSSFDTFITKRFDRQSGQRIHFASAMTMLNRQDGDHDASYLEMVDFLIKHGSQVQSDLEELWKRIVFNICVSNTDDHLKNHGFLLTDKGWKLAPAYDINPSESANGLTLNIPENDNSQNTALALEVADYFRLSPTKAKTHLSHIKKAVSNWKALAKRKFPASEIDRMRHAFRVVE